MTAPDPTAPPYTRRRLLPNPPIPTHPHTQARACAHTHRDHDSSSSTGSSKIYKVRGSSPPPLRRWQRRRWDRGRRWGLKTRVVPVVVAMLRNRRETASLNLNLVRTCCLAPSKNHHLIPPTIPIELGVLAERAQELEMQKSPRKFQTQRK